MTGCTYVTDIAVTSGGQIVGVGRANDGSWGILSINGTTGACSKVPSSGPTVGVVTALSFVAPGTVHPDKEMLVSFSAETDGDHYLSIDPDSGVVADLGVVSSAYKTSGDITSAQGGGTYWSAFGPCLDCLVELAPHTGAIIRNWGPIGADDVWGLASWGSDVYGFTATGAVLRISFGANEISTEVVLETNIEFHGAGA